MRTVAIFCCLAAGQAVFACSCPPWGPPCEAAWHYESVVRARVVDIDEPEEAPAKPGEPNSNRRRVKLYVEEALLGPQAAKSTMEVWTGRGGGDCGYPFERGVTYVVYANRVSAQKLVADTCSRTRPESEATEDLAYFRGLRERAPAGEIFGTVQSLTIAGYGAHTPQPLAGARVVLTGASVKKEAIAADDGKYRFGGLAPGKYDIAVFAVGYSRSGEIPALDLHAKGCREQDVYLGVDRRVRGHVKLADGTPADGIDLQLVPLRPRTEGDLMTPAYNSKSGSDGSYEFTNVDEGDYYLGMNAVNAPPATSKYPRWLYPGTSDSKAAVIVGVHGSAGSETFDLTLPEPQDSRVVSGQVMFPDGRPAARVMVIPAAVYSPFDMMVSAETDNEGRFRIPLPQRTVFRLRLWNPAAQQSDPAWAETIIPPSGDVPPLHLTLKPGRPPDHSRAILEAWQKGAGLP